MAQYHFHGFQNELCKDPNCPDCPEVHEMIQELRAVDPKFRREWRKLAARATRVPQRALRHAEYHRKRK